MFKDTNGNLSSTRVMAFLACISALVIAVGSVFMPTVTLGDALPMAITLLAYSFGKQVFNKAIETKN